MARLALLSLFLLVVAISAIAVSSALAPSGRASDAAQPQREDPMPKTTRTIAYVALLLLMLGVVTGLFGGA